MKGKVGAARRSGYKSGVLRIVAATRLGEAEFARRSELALSCAGREDATLRVAYDNAEGLPTVYNAALEAASDGDALLFTHDDVGLHDPDLVDRLEKALGRYDVVGVAGNRRRLPDQRTWFSQGERGVLDREWLAGAVRHGDETVVYGPAPAEARLLDGLFLASRAATLRRAGVAFDPRFRFHFYDLDFCRSCERAGLTMGVWPFDVSHASDGAFGSSDWNLAYYRYRAKWGD